ncbi:MAG: phosphoribosylformylglycinamidine synthase subunit PurQ [Thermomicrobiales bacterium]|nr:phosphoribosylformylglycinamidine synthase subunit PurQ [Thermomicrobiales bacterium]MCO5223799.1 phosphoribosylformylglycinamidine synthase subunit PurQ [Thermomicrobiales bacterium]MCO5228502.1 phosphoribosylformylglycinamidine synthase subunit PurQ [Thermomicrobiales bacterium]
MHVGVISFPGSNGDHDALANLESDLGVTVRRVDYRETRLTGLDAVVLPGGFSYGDALRCGAIARFAPVMTELQKASVDGLPILGICNGFQVLCEAHLLPGALLRNKTLKFHCHWTHLRFENVSTPWTNNLEVGEVLRLPVAHGEGSYFIGADELAQLEGNGQVVARYCDAAGNVVEAVNGSVNSIAAVCNESGNVVGLMPHPERATNDLIGGADGLKMLKSLLQAEPVAV